MISRLSLNDRVREWGLREEVVEKDYVLGWLLWGIGSEEALRDHWVFNGGTCLKKCYIETYRFSEDLDFTVTDGGPVAPADVLPIVERVLDRVNQASGIDFTVQAVRFRARPGHQASEGRVYYVGPRGAPGPARIKLDLDAEEVLKTDAEWREIAHPYDDPLPQPATVRCYSFLEVFAEKLRAMGERGRPRDLYDIINLFRRPDLRPNPGALRALLEEKCAHKGVPVPTLPSLRAAETVAELESEWENMLAHQLPRLPPISSFWNGLDELFAWLEGIAEPALLQPAPVRVAGLTAWEPPPTIRTWGTSSVESLRFAAQNRLLVEFDYVDEGGRFSHRRVEPYSLRQTADDNLILGVFALGRNAPRSFRIDRMSTVTISNESFQPRYATDIGRSSYSLPASASTRRSPAASRRRAPQTARHIVQCASCGKRFYRKRRSTAIRAHKAPDGWDCSGRSGIYVGMTS